MNTTRRTRIRYKQVRNVFAIVVLSTAIAPHITLAEEPKPGPTDIRVKESSDLIEIETDVLKASVRKTGYVSGLAAGTFLDKKTGAKDLGFGLHIMDFLLAPGWRDDGYQREKKLHGDLPKHYVEGPQICTQAKALPVEVVRGDKFVALKLNYTYTKPGEGFRAGSKWEQTIVFQPGVRYFISAETITSANDVDDLFYRVDMPGHIKHKGDDTFEQVYLSYRDKSIPASAFSADFGPDENFLYQRNDAKIPQRMIRAYQTKLDAKPGPWLAGMTLDPAAVSEAWCHERTGYVCFIEELHRRNAKAGETFGAAYVVGWFDDIGEMNRVYDQHKGQSRIIIDAKSFRLQ